MSISTIQQMTFGQNNFISDIKSGVKKVEVERDDLYNALLGTGGAAALVNATRIYRASKGIFYKNKNKNPNWFMKQWHQITENAEKSKIIGAIIKFYKKPAILKTSRIIGTITAITAGLIDIGNMINVGAKIFDTGKLPNIDLDN